AVRDDVDPGGTRRPPEAIERLAEPVRAALDVAAHGGVGDEVEVAPPVAPEPAREPGEVGGVLRVAVQQDDRRARIARVERPHARGATPRGQPLWPGVSIGETCFSPGGA